MSTNKFKLSFISIFFFILLTSYPVHAAWTPDAPTALGTDLAGIVMDTGDGLVAVGDDGKAYHMTAANMVDTTAANVVWAQVYPPASTDFVGVAHDGSNFWAATENGTIVSSADGITWATASLTAAARTAIDGKTVVGIACPGADVVVVTNDGAGAYFDFGVGWASIGANLSGETIATTSSIKGVRELTGTADAFVVFGGGGGNNLYNVTKAGVLTAGLNVNNCPVINDISIQTATSWYAVGDSAKIVLGTTDLAVGGAVATAALTVTGGSSPNFLSIDYNTADTFGYVAGASGEVFRVSGEAVTYKAQGIATENLNGVALVISGSLRRAFIVGNAGASLYGGETFWNAVLTGATKDVATAPGDPQSIVALSGTYYIPSGDDEKLYSSTAPTTSWASAGAVSTQAVESGAIAGAEVTTDDYVAVKVAGTGLLARITIFTNGAATGLITALAGTPPVTADYIAALNGNFYFTSSDGTKFVQSIAFASGDANSADASIASGIAVSGLAASANGLYLIGDAGAVKAMAATGTPTVLTNLSVNTNVWTTATDINTAIGTATGLYPTSDGKLIIVDNTNKIFLVSDSGGAAIGTLAAVDQNYSGAAPTYVSGSSTDLIVSTATDVWRYNAASWEKYDGLSTAISVMNAVDGVASSGANAVAIDTDGLNTNRGIAYSTGASFAAAAPETQPDVSSTINTIYNATSTDIYVGGDNGLLYKGVYASESFTWTRVNEGVVGSKPVNRLTGYGSNVFGLIKGGTEMIMYDGTNWSAVTNNPPVAFTDIKAVSATTLYASTATAANYLYKITIAGTTATYTPQTKGGGAGVLVALNALDVSTDGQTLYGVGAGNNALKLTSPVADAWTVEQITMPGAAPTAMYDVVIQEASKVYMVGDTGYAVSYDGSTATLITAPAATILNSVWAYETHVYAADSNGYVHDYNTSDSTWTSGLVQASTNIKVVSGSAKGGFLVSGGQNGVLKRTTISSSGGGDSSSAVQPGAGEDSDLISSASSSVPTSTALTTSYGTPSMTVLGRQQSFQTKAITADSTHNFLFTFTPSTNIAVNDLKLFKLLASTSSNLTYSRLNAAPASATDGVYWITDNSGGVMVSGETLSANSVYTVNFGIKDNGSYDTNTAAGVIADPVVLGATSSSGSSGCVFNPAQSMSLEWILLMITPFLVAVRNRYKK
ncbi:hypothetical protein SAMN05660337_3176 [Maridesulfovibrio ferrireducens]|uniref:Uncharacterized protein n=1 Tax=Maridesulfovibrio ferrireducens TaxID=246191 RepID=A0A1G9KQ93_9BACT|nr:hypothetical protein [Maridesulfovibrio ferrireducens]SDL51861.1 hypothetical protein SAMN05660337_3176 [Maridesulfovibrio ferrireducens]